MARYLLFREDYHPVGGWNDFENANDNFQELLDLALTKLVGTGWHIVDLKIKRIAVNHCMLKPINLPKKYKTIDELYKDQLITGYEYSFLETSSEETKQKLVDIINSKEYIMVISEHQKNWISKQ